LGDFEEEITSTYTLNESNNGLYMFVLEGELIIGGQTLKRRDGLGIWETDQITLTTKVPSKVLLMEVPMA
jgi:redox-sensitive bicupin YhaK (pirin superfamily)